MKYLKVNSHNDASAKRVRVWPYFKMHNLGTFLKPFFVNNFPTFLFLLQQKAIFGREKEISFAQFQPLFVI